jgi:hypothetical protein
LRERESQMVETFYRLFRVVKEREGSVPIPCHSH